METILIAAIPGILVGILVALFSDWLARRRDTERELSERRNVIRLLLAEVRRNRGFAERKQILVQEGIRDPSSGAIGSAISPAYEAQFFMKLIPSLPKLSDEVMCLVMDYYRKVSSDEEWWRERYYSKAGWLDEEIRQFAADYGLQVKQVLELGSQLISMLEREIGQAK